MIEFGIEEKVRKTVIDWVQKAMKKSKFPDGKAKLGYFEAADGSKENADNVCILVVHYEFRNAKNKDNIRGGDERDVKSLRRSFETNRNCKFIDWSSPKREELLYLLSDQDLLLKLFGAEDSPPSVFFLFILSHGCENGEICTDHAESFDGKVEKFQTFTTTELFAALKKLRKFENCLKFINLAPCRGDTRDLISSIVNQNHQKLSAFDSKSCSVSSFPEMENLVIFYSTVETTAAVRETKNGTWFVQKTCQVLNDLRRTSESLPVVLTRIQNKIQESSHEIMQVSCKDKWIGQTPELKMFPQKRKFFFLPVDSNSKSDGIGKIVIEEPEPLPFWSWPLVGGNQRIKRASVFYTQRTKMVVDFYNALRQNLGFEADDLMENSVGNLSKYFTRINDVAKHTECFLTGVFAKITEKDEEICVRFDDNEVPIGAFIHRFLGPEHENWIGKPKIFIFCEQSPRQSQGDGLKELEIPAATNHSGWLVLVIQDEEKIKTLIEILNSDVLTQNGTSLQEKIYDLLLHQKIGKNNNTLLVSTLQYLLNFPDLPRNFVKPTFSAEVERKTVDYDELLNDWAKGIDQNSFRLLSSPAGSGKTTVMREIAHGLRKLNKTIVEVNLRDLVDKNFSKWNSETPIAEILAEAMKFPQAHVQALVNKKILILFLDGFDEICPDHGEKMLDLAKRMFDKEIQIFISTRPQEKKAIVDKLGQKNCFAYEILPFNRQQQIELLKLERQSKNDFELDKFKNWELDEFLGIPLHLIMMGKCRLLENPFQIIEEIIKLEIETALAESYVRNDQFDSEVEKLLEWLMSLAMRFIQGESPNVTNNAHFVNVNRTRIASVTCEKINFLHHLFPEVLVTKKFLVFKFSIFGNSKWRPCRKLVENLLAEKKFEAEISENLGCVLEKKPLKEILDEIEAEDLQHIRAVIEEKWPPFLI
ncbi:uncharacterized protein LOC132204199 isoform X4 [Neocloeon triangulifer]|uniref:uncharacterized protein LOC132204199 isoform X4 n=1 Tax=Neocloeon triangulifer TaxID=2078957 RepID=UPI00286F3450|nr:uncharacterized protein LOC132204199 isoform X4 [Neocloeon triangulifer]